MDKEIWKDIEGYEGRYQVSNLGRVRSLNFKGHSGKVKVLKNTLYGNGYYCVTLYKNGKVIKHSIHRLVALAFISNSQNKKEVNHINGIKTDNRVENLEWNTYSENLLHAYKKGLNYSTNRKFTTDEINVIRSKFKYGDKQYGVTALARLYGVSNTVISEIIQNKTYKDEKYIPPTWKLSKNIIEKICSEYVYRKKGFGADTLAKKYGVSPTTIKNIIKKYK